MKEYYTISTTLLHTMNYILYSRCTTLHCNLTILTLQIASQIVDHLPLPPAQVLSRSLLEDLLTQGGCSSPGASALLRSPSALSRAPRARNIAAISSWPYLWWMSLRVILSHPPNLTLELQAKISQSWRRPKLALSHLRHYAKQALTHGKYT